MNQKTKIYFVIIRYDPVSEEWEKIGTLGTLRSYFTSVVCKRQLYLIGGEGGRKEVSLVTAFDPYDNQWRSVKPMLTPRADAGTC